jgi:hypothetical protein
MGTTASYIIRIYKLFPNLKFTSASSKLFSLEVQYIVLKEEEIKMPGETTFGRCSVESSLSVNRVKSESNPSPSQMSESLFSGLCIVLQSNYSCILYYSNPTAHEYCRIETGSGITEVKSTCYHSIIQIHVLQINIPRLLYRTSHDPSSKIAHDQEILEIIKLSFIKIEVCENHKKKI